jgi:putative SOS response-associated peptidase YedK
MAVILPEDRMRDWIEAGEMDAGGVNRFLTAFPPGEMEMFPVGRAVNNPGFDSAKCIERVEAASDSPAPEKSRRRRDAGSEQSLF